MTLRRLFLVAAMVGCTLSLTACNKGDSGADAPPGANVQTKAPPSSPPEKLHPKATVGN